MSKQNLEMNFNVFDENAIRQELIKAQAYINDLNALVEALQTQIEALKKRLDASPY